MRTHLSNNELISFIGQDDLEEMRRRYRIITAPVPTQGVTYASHQGKLASPPGGAVA